MKIKIHKQFINEDGGDDYNKRLIKSDVISRDNLTTFWKQVLSALDAFYSNGNYINN